jgi:thymidylate synthase (FAD)
MMVSLISYSQNLNTDRSDGNSLMDMIAFCARVSNPSNQNNTETSEKLIRYLIKNNHWSPFEMVHVCLEITTTRDIARQILRHRSFSFQEFSQRYADPTKDLKFVTRDARLQDSKNRQNSIETEDVDLNLNWETQQKYVIDSALKTYRWAIDHGIAKEQARAVLPEGMTESKLYMSGTMRSWIHYIELRSGKETQKEHRQISLECAKAIKPIFPMISEFVSQ